VIYKIIAVDSFLFFHKVSIPLHLDVCFGAYKIELDEPNALFYVVLYKLSLNFVCTVWRWAHVGLGLDLGASVSVAKEDGVWCIEIVWYVH
jgi:hypothetical protein